jgi:transposase-like protein
MIKEQAKEQARKLYMQSGLSQQQIAGNVGVNPRTLYGWIREGDWKRARKAALAIPLMLLEQNYIQFVSMNEDILSREDRPYPTKEEADIMRKLSATIRQLKEPGNVALADTTQVLMQFSMYLRKRDKDMSLKLINFMNDYIEDMRPDKRTLMSMYDERDEIMNAPTDIPSSQVPVQEEAEQNPTAQPVTPVVPDSNTDINTLSFDPELLADHINSQAKERQQVFADMYKEATGKDLVLPQPNPMKEYDAIMARRHLFRQENQYPATGS